MSNLTIQVAERSDTERLPVIYRIAYLENRDPGFPAKAENASMDVYEATLADDEVRSATSMEPLLGLYERN